MTVTNESAEGIVLVSTAEMQALYLDGELLEQAPQLSIECVLEHLGIPFQSHFLSSPCNPTVRRNVFPIQLARVTLENDVYVSAQIAGNNSDAE